MRYLVTYELKQVVEEINNFSSVEIIQNWASFTNYAIKTIHVPHDMLGEYAGHTIITRVINALVHTND